MKDGTILNIYVDYIFDFTNSLAKLAKNEVITMLCQYKQYKHDNRDGSFIILNIIAQTHTEWNNILYVYHSMMLIYIHFTLLIPVLSVEIMNCHTYYHSNLHCLYRTDIAIHSYNYFVL